MSIILKSDEEIEKMRVAGDVVAETLEALTAMARPGRKTLEFEQEALRIFEARGARSIFKGHNPQMASRPYPGQICVSVNEELVHGIPAHRELVEGDVISFDVGVAVEGWCADAARTIGVGNVSAEVKRLLEITEEVLELAIREMKPGLVWSAAAAKMEKLVLDAGFSVVTQFVGHGIGREMWEEPQVPNYVSAELRRKDIVLRKGMTLAVEPMVNVGKPEVRVGTDGWTVVTVDGKASAHCEDTIAIGEDGAVPLTRRTG